MVDDNSVEIVDYVLDESSLLEISFTQDIFNELDMWGDFNV